MAPPPSLAQLEKAALHIIHLIRDTPTLENTKLAVVGDLAVSQYLPVLDRPASIDFVISKASSPSRVKKETVNHPMSPLVEKAGVVYIKLPTGQQVEVKFIPDWVCPYLPDAARPVKKVERLPYISLEDLLVFKVDACGLRDSNASKQLEACEAAALLEVASEHGPLELDEDKLEIIEEGLLEIVEFCEPEHDKSWWQRSLGIVPDKQRSVKEILEEIVEHPASPSMPTPPTSPRSLSKRSSIYSTMSRTSSSASSISGISRTSSSASSMSTMSTFSSISSITTPDDVSTDKMTRPRKLSVTGNTSRHKRHPSSGVAPKNSLVDAMQRMEIGRPSSPGVALTNRI